jgi:hypothetical protein
MRLLLHAVTTSKAAAICPTGLRAQPLIVVRHAEMSACASRFDAPPERFGRADLLAHHDIISNLAAQMDVLPARFPTWLADEEAIRRELECRRDDLVEALERVGGCVELAVTAVWNAASDEIPPPEAATSGREYLLGRQQAFSASDKRRARARQLADQTERLIGADVVEVRHQVCPSATVALSSAVLVSRASAESVKARLARAEHDVRILINGPWPPYTFADVV